MATTFLQAEWRKLAIANYEVDKKTLYKYLPYKTELDLWDNACYVSLIGFMFLNTRLLAVKIPFHVNFEEVNLRFYVRYKSAGQWKRGVVFIKEIVPKPALAFIANTIYYENYQTMPMQHLWVVENDLLTVDYRWKKEKWNSLKLIAAANPEAIKEGSEEEFITEHYWGYTKVSNSKTSEYGVEHPRWQVYRVIDHTINVDFEDIYGPEFACLTTQKPKSVFLAEGSTVVVKKGITI